MTELSVASEPQFAKKLDVKLVSVLGRLNIAFKEPATSAFQDCGEKDPSRSRFVTACLKFECTQFSKVSDTDSTLNIASVPRGL